MSERVSKADMACNKPRRTPGHPKKSHVVKACYDGKEKLIRFGEQGASTAGKPKEGESERMKTKRASFKARHAKNIAKGPSSPAYWANKVKWAEGGEVKMASGGSAALALIEQMRRSGARSQEFDPVLVAMREQRARPARRSVMPQAAPRMPEPQAEALPLPPVPPAMRPDENPPPEAPRSPLRFDEGNPHVATAIRMAERYGLPTNIFLSLVQQESRFDPNARSRRGAIGLGQLMPGTARELGVDPTDPEQNLEGSARYLRRMLDQFGDMSLALAAYNAGPGTVRRAGNTIPNIRETQNYVPSILRRAGVSGPEGFAEGGEVSEPRGALNRFGNYLYNTFLRPNDMGMAANERALSEGIPGGAGGPRDAIRHMVASSYTTPLGVTASELLNGDMLNSLVGDNQATWDRANNALGQRLRSVPEGERYDRAKNMVLQQLRHLVEYGEMSGSLPSFDPRFTVVDRDALGNEIVYGPREIIGWIESGRMPRLSDDSRVLRSDIYTSGSIGDRLRPASRRDRAPTSVPATPNKFAEGGIADLEQKYAEGGEVAPYDPEAVEALVRSVEGSEGLASDFSSARERQVQARDLVRAEAARIIESLPEISGGGIFTPIPGGRVIGGGANARLNIPLGPNSGALDLSAGYQGASASGRGFRSNQNRLTGAGIGYTDPTGGRISLDYHDRIMGDPDTLPGADPIDLMGRPVPSRGLRLGYRREFAEGGLAELEDKYAEGGAVMSDEEYDRRLLSRMKEQTGRVTEPTRAEQMQALRTAGRSAAEGVADVLLPQSPLDAALMVALGPGGRAARLAGAGALAALEPSEAEASRLRRLIRAYHGSPHKFDEFDIRKIGTGEGAQAYGRGLYFAENEDIAKHYRTSLSGDPTINNRVLNWSDPSEHAAAIVYAEGSPEKAIQALTKEVNYLRGTRGFNEETHDAARALRYLQQNKSLPSLQTPGYMYEVDLNASPRDFLNWDLPLSQQSREVQESLQRFGFRADPDAARAYDDALLDALYNDPSRPLPPRPRDPTGGEIYESSRLVPGAYRDAAAAADALREVGIPGTRYLDAGSRGVGGGTYNYAVFDPEIIDIVRRYAKGGLAELENKYAEGGEVSAMTYDPDAVDALVKEIEAEYV